MITGLTPVPTATNTKDTSQVSGENAELGKDDFMQLLVAQLQAQDPTNPMDAQDFSAQLAQFSSVEQLFNVNTNLDEIKSAQTALNNNSMVNLIGKSVDSPGNGITLKLGQTETIAYSLPADAAAVSIEIFDSTGDKVNTISEGNQSQGVNSMVWSGLDNKGEKLPSGQYTYNISATDTSGNDLIADSFSSGVVKQVTFEDGVSYAYVNGTKIPVSEITQVGLN